MVATIAAGTSAGYYLSQSEYYLGGSEPPGIWIASGAGFVIAPGEYVEREAFERLHEGLGQDGRTLLSNSGGRVDRVPGYDMTFSAPKTVSVLWALADETLRQEIEAAQAAAVKAAIGLVERNASFSRRGKGGVPSEAIALTVAAFQHGEARPTKHADGRVFADPQLHTHAVILNLAKRVDGTVGTLDGRRLFAWKMAAGAAYHLELSSGLQKLGFDIDDIGRNGLFELAGVDGGLAEYFSARRAEIETELEAAGATSATAPALAGAITKASRAVKQTKGDRDRFALWQDVAADLGHETVRVVDRARRAGERDTALNRSRDREAAIAKQLGLIPDRLTQTESVFERRELVAAVASALVGSGASMDRAEREVARLVENGCVVELGADALGEKVYSSPELLRIERDVFKMAQALAERQMREPDPVYVNYLIERHHLNPEQARAARAATSGSAIAAIEGAAGSGKTTSLRPIVTAHRIAGYRIVGTATAWRIAHQLRDDLRIEARATEAWLAASAAGQRFLDDQTLLVVDEAGQLSSRQMHAILSEATRAGARVLLVGDRRQLQPIGAGGALSIVARAVDFARVDEIVRQREEWQRQAVVALAAGRAGDALQSYTDRAHVHLNDGYAATVTALVDVRERMGTDDPDQAPLLLARTNRQVRDINAEVRVRLRARGVLGGPDVGIDAVAPSGQAYRLDLAAGDEIRFLARHDRLGVVNGTTAAVLAIARSDRDGVTITVRLSGRDIPFLASDLADADGRVRIGHAYASTVYGAQGLTSETALVLLDPAYDRHDTYVALSRSRGRTEIFVDRRTVASSMRAEQPLANRECEIQPADSAVIDWIAERVSRTGVKSTTLDYHAAVGCEAGRDRQMADRTRMRVRMAEGPDLIR